MRISTTQLYTEATRNMLEGQSKLADIQSKIASGKNFTSLVEDPVGVSQVVNLKRELAQFEVFDTNIDATRRRLELEESTLDQLNIAVTRSQELLLQASNGTLTDADRTSISYELDELVKYAASLMNTQDAKGEYIFAGSKGTTPAYVLNGDGTYTYQGDDTRKQIQVGSSQFLDSTDTGKYLFESIQGDVSLTLLGGASNPSLASSLGELSITDQSEFERFMRQTGDLRLSVTEGDLGQLYYSVRDSSNQFVTDADGTELAFIPYYDGTNPLGLEVSLNLPGSTVPITLPSSLTAYGVASDDINNPEVTITGDGADFFAVDPSLNEPDTESFVGLYVNNAPGPFSVEVTYTAATTQYAYTVVNANGDPVPFMDSDPNDDIIEIGGWSVQMSAGTADYLAEFELVLDPAEEVSFRLEQPKGNLLNALADSAQALKTLSARSNEERLELKERLSSALGNLGSVQERFSQSVAGIGARLNTMESAQFSNLDFKLLTESTLSAVEDVDYASAATELAKRQLALEASFASFAKIQGLSLFNYIN